MAPKLKVSADALRAAIEKMKIDHPTLLSIDVDTLDAAQLKAFRLFCMQGFYEKGPRQAARDARNIVDEVNEKKRLLEERIANAKQAVVPVKEQMARHKDDMAQEDTADDASTSSSDIDVETLQRRSKSLCSTLRDSLPTSKACKDIKQESSWQPLSAAHTTSPTSSSVVTSPPVRSLEPPMTPRDAMARAPVPAAFKYDANDPPSKKQKHA